MILAAGRRRTGGVYNNLTGLNLLQNYILAPAELPATELPVYAAITMSAASLTNKALATGNPDHPILR